MLHDECASTARSSPSAWNTHSPIGSIMACGAAPRSVSDVASPRAEHPRSSATPADHRFRSGQRSSRGSSAGRATGSSKKAVRLGVLLALLQSDVHGYRSAVDAALRAISDPDRVRRREGRAADYFLSVVVSGEAVSGSSAALASARPFLNSFWAEPRLRASFGICDPPKSTIAMITTMSHSLPLNMEPMLSPRRPSHSSAKRTFILATSRSDVPAATDIAT